MSQAGFSSKEITDFTDYWIPRLSESPYYALYPQYAQDLASMVEINCMPAPDEIFRLFYAIKGLDSGNVNLTDPVTQKANNEGFVIREWGVIPR